MEQDESRYAVVFAGGRVASGYSEGRELKVSKRPSDPCDRLCYGGQPLIESPLDTRRQVRSTECPSR